MKKIVSIFLILMMLGLAACGNDESITDGSNTENASKIAEDFSKAADEIVVKEEDIIVEEDIKDAECQHSWGDWIPQKNTTCTEDGNSQRTCRKCGGTQTRLDPATGHVPQVIPAVAATCEKSGLTEGLVCSVCHGIIAMQELVSKTAHNFEWVIDLEKTADTDGVKHLECKDCHEVKNAGTIIPKGNHAHVLTETPAVAATCQSEGNIRYWTCSICGEKFADAEAAKTVSDKEIITEKLAHTVELIPGKKATADAEGLTDGLWCSVCHEVIREQEKIIAYKYSDPDLYASDYGYKDLAKLENGEAMQTLYTKLNDICTEFHKDTSKNLTEYYMGYVNYKELGLTKNQALIAFAVFRTDHPLFYWLGNTITVNTNVIAPEVDSDYYEGTVRAGYNNMIYETSESFDKEYDFASKTAYETAKILHDIIIDNIEYATDESGEAETANWAHNILGFFENKKGVCECYAKCFNLFLNCFGVESVIVNGYTGSERHEWNMVKLDNDEWYYCDLTWDDARKEIYDSAYIYFCVTENQSVSYTKDGQTKSAPAIGKSHKIQESNISDKSNYQYGLPKCSVNAYCK